MSAGVSSLITLGAILFGIGVCFLLGWLAGALWGMRRDVRYVYRLQDDYFATFIENTELRRRLRLIDPFRHSRTDNCTPSDQEKP